MKLRIDSLAFGALLLLCASFAHSQVSVVQAPPIHFQFFTSSGLPLSNGKLYTYIGGTTTLQNTYVDSTGTTQNPDPIPLDVTGSPSNGSTQTSIFLSNASWKFVAFDVNNVQQWSVDNVTTTFALLNTANTWTATQTFSQAIVDTQTDNQFITGTPGNQTTLDFPPPAANVTLHFPNIADTVVARTTTDTLTNKTLTSPTINTPTLNGTLVPNGPATYLAIANANPTGTTTSTLTILLNAPAQATIATTSTTTGVIGICASACGNTGTAIIQQSGLVNCVFDGATTAGDYVGVSSSVAGDCTDIGASALTGNFGRVLSTNGGAGTYSIDLFPQRSNLSTVTADGTTTIASASTTSAQPLKCVTVAPAGGLNQLGKLFRATAQVQLVAGGGASNQTVSWNIQDGSAGCLGGAGGAASYVTTSANASNVNTNSVITCVVATTGSSGVVNCSMLTTSDIGTVRVLLFNPTVNLTHQLTIGNQCSFSVASGSNVCNQYQLDTELLN